MTEVAAVSAASEKRFTAALQHRYFLRVHMSAMLALTLIAGIFADRLLLRVGLNILAIRYFVSVCTAYFVFVTSVKLWLFYLGFTVASAASRRSGGTNWIDGFDFSSGGSGSSSSSGSASFSGGGGKFGGGGATGSWGDSDAKPSMVPALLSSKGSGGGKSGGGGSSDDLGELMLVVLVIAVVVAAVASFFWVIWAAPGILGETAFNAVLAGALAKHAHKASHGTWIGSVMKKTMIPFLLILALTTFLGWYAQHYCPGAMRLSDAMHCTNPAF